MNPKKRQLSPEAQSLSLSVAVSVAVSCRRLRHRRCRFGLVCLLRPVDILLRFARSNPVDAPYY